MAGSPDREKALGLTLAQIDKQFGKGSVMRLGERPSVPMSVIPTGSIALDVALGIGGLPRGRVVEIYGPESSGKTTVALHAIANAQSMGGIAAFIDAEHALDPDYAQALGVDTDALLVSQPDTGEQALEIADMLVRSGALDIIVIDSVAALVPRAEIEGEIGDSHVGLQARLMSQALRKITGALNTSNTTAIFINQLREKIGVMFGCASWHTEVTLADGSRLPIGRVVDERMAVEVLSYDPTRGAVVPRKVVSWFNNGPAREFLELEVARGVGEDGVDGGSGQARARMALTANHLVRTPGGWRAAGEIAVGDRVLLAQPHRLSQTQWQVVLGSLLGASNLLTTDAAGDGGVRLRMVPGAGSRMAAHDWKAPLLANIPRSQAPLQRQGGDFGPLPELGELYRAVYLGNGAKHVSDEYLKALTPLALAVWYADNHDDLRGGQGDPSGGARVDVRFLSQGSRERLVSYLREVWDLDVELVGTGLDQPSVVLFTRTAVARFHELVAAHGEPAPAEPVFMEPTLRLSPARVLGIRARRDYPTMDRYDLEIEGSHNYLADGIMVHNSPETTTGGRALKFYASVRLDVRRIETLKDSTEAVGNRTRVKVVKNKVSAPFKQAEFDIMYGKGISREGSLIDVGVEQGIIRKSGAWYTYEGDQLGQGKENARAFLREHPDVAAGIEKQILEKLGVGAADSASFGPPVDF